MNPAFTPIPPERLAALRATHEQPRQSRWSGNTETVHPKVLPLAHGDGEQAVELSFYAAPEVAIIVLVDSELPLEDIGDGHGDPQTFRSMINDIYDLCEDQWSNPPAGDERLEELNQLARMEAAMNEVDADDMRSLWSLTIEDGSTWIGLAGAKITKPQPNKMTPFTDPNGEPIVAIEYQDGIPHQVWTTRTMWDFNICDHGDTWAYHNSGSGGVYYNGYCQTQPITNQIWIAKKTKISKACGKRRVKMPNRKSQTRYHSQWRKTKPTTGHKARKRLARAGLRFLTSPLQFKGGGINPFYAYEATESEAQWCDTCQDRKATGEEACWDCGNLFNND
jgi:hypothetical protein